MRKKGGTRFYSKSALYHVHGEYTFTPTFVDKWVVGANGRMYRPDSDGTIFYDTANVVITNTEFGAYTGVDKSFFDGKVKTSATLRIDKNQNFNLVATPAASVVYIPKPNNYLRASFSSAVRNPTLSDQYLFLDVGRATLVGNLNGADSLVTVESFTDFRNTQISDTLAYFDIDPIQPEKVKTFELGYRTTLFDAVYMDAGYYFSIYDDFLGYNLGLELDLDPLTNLINDVKAYRYSANSKNRVTTQGFSIGLNYYFAKYYMVAGNYSWNRLNKILEDDPIIPAFNTPEHKFNLSISGRDIKFKLGSLNVKNIGFNINYKWIQGFLFEGSPQFTGEIPTYDLLDGQINYKLPKKNLTFKLGASNILNKMNFQTYGGPRIGRLAYFSIVYDWQEK